MRELVPFDGGWRWRWTQVKRTLGEVGCRPSHDEVNGTGGIDITGNACWLRQ